MKRSTYRHTLAVLVVWTLLSTDWQGEAQTARTPAKTSANEAVKARALCDALHTLPAGRKNACCGMKSASLTDVCVQEVSASLRRGAVTLAGEGVARCREETSRLLEGCSWVTPLLPALPDACRGLLIGTLKAGLACRSSLECVDGFYCKSVAPTKSGVCSPPAPAGGRCETPADNLAAFARAKDDPRHGECQGRCVKGQCLPLSPQGGTCASSASCAPGLQCVSGTCQAKVLPKLGETCSGSTSCEPGAFCEAGHCMAAKDKGETCSMPFECRALECVKSPGTKSRTCGDPCGGSR